MNKRPLYIHYAGSTLLESPLLNKGSAFTETERESFNLKGLLPYIEETIEEQTNRAYEQLSAFNTDIDKHIYLRNIQDTNETLYFRLVTDHLEEIMPLIYTPTVGKACQQFSHIYRRHRGLFIAYNDRHHINDVLHNASKRNVKVIVVTDGERILGLGDLGVGGMGIPIGKLALYSACGGISPAYTLPVTLDIGCNNPQLINDPMYLGWRHPRITGDEYDDFIDSFIHAIKRRWPNALLQFEDFSQRHATPLLQRYRDQLCCFNDDIQGTAAVTVGTLLAACKAKGQALKDQRITFLGAGSAGCGIAEQIIAQMVCEGMTEQEARTNVTVLNRFGLITDRLTTLLDFQKPLCQPESLVQSWGLTTEVASLGDVIKHFKTTVLVGVSGQPGLFNEAVIRALYANEKQPIILPLSNPISQIEVHPEDALRWTDGNAIIATGSPINPVHLNGTNYPIAQCNNSYIFPGIGLGVVASNANRVTDNMLMASSHALADCSPRVLGTGDHLLPPLNEIRAVSLAIAIAVYKQAMDDGVAPVVSKEDMHKNIQQNFWTPEYRNYKRVAH
ncbi:NAD-dependent malic enzyme [Candidatus Endobugula sertula]|uniref:NAD-dependent malic enzyme n=1 Tax=Candidatus Endobugula sertula TaxID=62101 RepID=A0A1D2QMF1_9GAMM|nr:NAD-dependent malic enzyme [Candidatus Endobugula sertula]